MKISKLKDFTINVINIFIIIGLTPVFSNYGKIGLTTIQKVHSLIFFIVGYFLIIFHIKKFIRNSRDIIKNKYLYSFLFLIFCISLIVSNYKFDTLKSCISLLILSFYALYIVDHYKINCMIKITLYAQFVICILVYIYQYVYPNLSVELYEGVSVWRSSFYSKNSLSIEMAFGILISYSAFKFLENKVLAILTFFMSGFAIVKSGSATSIIIAIAVILISYLYKLLKVKFNIINAMYILHIVLYTLVILGQKFNDVIQGVINRDLTLTGRVYIWEGVLDVIKYNPYFGTGYGTFWGYQDELENIILQKYYSILNTRIIGAHNGFLDLILQIGIVGTILFVLVLWECGKKLKYIDNMQIKDFCLMYFVYFFTFIMTERSFGANSYQTLFLFISCILINLNYKKE